MSNLSIFLGILLIIVIIVTVIIILDYSNSGEEEIE